MCRDAQPDGFSANRNREFTTTHWSVVLTARDKGSSQAQQALAELCQTYWYPLYAYVRRRGYAAHDAQDLTQEFLSRFIRKEWLGRLQDQRPFFSMKLVKGQTLSALLALRERRSRQRDEHESQSCRQIELHHPSHGPAEAGRHVRVSVEVPYVRAATDMLTAC